MDTKQYLISDLENRWIPVGEALPPQGIGLLVATNVGVWNATYNLKTGAICIVNSSMPLKGVTHWRLKPRNPNFYYGENGENGQIDLTIPNFQQNGNDRN